VGLDEVRRNVYLLYALVMLRCFVGLVWFFFLLFLFIALLVFEGTEDLVKRMYRYHVFLSFCRSTTLLFFFFVHVIVGGGAVAGHEKVNSN
jgi:hypothetical protein